MKDKKVVLCIIDGLGISNKDNEFNSFHMAKTPTFDYIFSNYPNTQLSTDGPSVGLPEGMMGNSEVGHITIGAGRPILQDIQRINEAIKSGDIFQNDAFISLLEHHKNNKGDCHLVCLLSDGGIHSHIDHLLFFVKTLSDHNIRIKIHIMTDGRDVYPKTAIGYINTLQNFISSMHSAFSKNGPSKNVDSKNVCSEKVSPKKAEISTIVGRYHAMDRDKNYDRTKIAIDAIMFGKCENKFDCPIDLIKSYYEAGVTDEFFMPAVYSPRNQGNGGGKQNDDHENQCNQSDLDDSSYKGIKNNDSIFLCNFRSDRMRQITEKIMEEVESSESFKGVNIFSMTEYASHFNDEVTPLFQKTRQVANTLNLVLLENKKRQLRIAETEKYAHVTYFFNCGIEKENEFEDRILVKSPKIEHFTQAPEMSAFRLNKHLIEEIKSEKYDFICVNFANLDIIGHSGDLKAGIAACECIDQCLKELIKTTNENGYILLIISDHGNIEEMFNSKMQQPHTFHTLNPVPFVLIGHDNAIELRENGTLADVAPTILKIMNIKKPDEMRGCSLII